MNFIDDDYYMRRALILARKGLGKSSPNPAVGAVVVKNNSIIGEGFHEKRGDSHAEINALNSATTETYGATLYVTLEPCHHLGKTPPCTEAILKSGISRVVYGLRDPNPHVNRGGAFFLQKKGLDVVSGVLGEDCEHEHRFFLKYISTGLPYVILKTAASLDGKIATYTGDSRWISGEKSRFKVHFYRSWLDAICVGSGTILKDDPSLTCRLQGGRDPLRVIIDTSLKISLKSKVLIGKGKNKNCLIFCGTKASEKKRSLIEALGIEIVTLPLISKGGIDLFLLLKHLGKRGIVSVLLESGGTLAWGFLEKDLIDEVLYFYAPKLIGGKNSFSMLSGEGFCKIKDVVRLDQIKVRSFGGDIMVQGKVLRLKES